MNLEESTILALSGKLNETKGSDKTYTCIEDRQHGDFCVGATMTAEEWGETAMGWADNDGWDDPEEPLLRNFKTEQDCINFIDDMWEITIVPSDDPKAKEFLDESKDVEIPSELQDYVNSWKKDVGGDVKSIQYLGGESTPNDTVKINNVMYKFNRNTKKLVGKLPASFTDKLEARSHKEDNEKAAPREDTKKSFGELSDVPKRARFNGKSGWGYYDADENAAQHNGISKNIQSFKDLRAKEKTARATSDYYKDDFDRMNKFAKSALERDDDKDFDRLTRLARKSGRLSNTFKKSADELAQQATDLVKAKSREELTEGKLLMTGYEQGMCPKCKTPIFNYGDINWYDDGIGQEFICHTCNLSGEEFFKTTFDCIELEKPATDL